MLPPANQHYSNQVLLSGGILNGILIITCHVRGGSPLTPRFDASGLEGLGMRASTFTPALRS